MLTFAPRAQDHYAVLVYAGSQIITGDRFHTRPEAEAYAARQIELGYVVRGTCPSYDRVSLTERYG